MHPRNAKPSWHGLGASTNPTSGIPTSLIEFSQKYCFQRQGPSAPPHAQSHLLGELKERSHVMSQESGQLWRSEGRSTRPSSNLPPRPALWKRAPARATKLYPGIHSRPTRHGSKARKRRYQKNSNVPKWGLQQGDLYFRSHHKALLVPAPFVADPLLRTMR